VDERDRINYIWLSFLNRVIRAIYFIRPVYNGVIVIYSGILEHNRYFVSDLVPKDHREADNRISPKTWLENFRLYCCSLIAKFIAIRSRRI
jgi:hypothetical protein